MNFIYFILAVISSAVIFVLGALMARTISLLPKIIEQLSTVIIPPTTYLYAIPFVILVTAIYFFLQTLDKKTANR